MTVMIVVRHVVTTAVGHPDVIATAVVIDVVDAVVAVEEVVDHKKRKKNQ